MEESTVAGAVHFEETAVAFAAQVAGVATRAGRRRNVVAAAAGAVQIAAHENERILVLRSTA